MEAKVGRTKSVALAVAGLLALTLALVAAGVVPTQAQEPPPPIQPEELTAGNRGEFTDRVSMQLRRKMDGRGTEVVNMPDPSHVAVVRFVIQPGAQFPWHIHPGSVIVTVTQGLLVYVEAQDCVHRPYPAGTAFVDTGDNVHSAYNPTEGETVLVAVFLDSPATGPLTIPQPTDPDEIAALNERCGLNALN
jgi:quercetin dioxygenase-like cupin family protein